MRRAAKIVLVVLGMGLAVLWQRQLRAAPPDEHPADLNLAIVVNTSNTVEGLSHDELRRIFLGEQSHWPNGRRITLVMMEPGRPERQTIIREVCRMNETDYRNHILHGLFTGEIFVSPKTLASPKGVTRFVFNVPGAIGYIRATDVTSDVKALRIDGHLPDDKAYPLRIDQHRAK